MQDEIDYAVMNQLLSKGKAKQLKAFIGADGYTSVAASAVELFKTLAKERSACTH